MGNEIGSRNGGLQAVVVGRDPLFREGLGGALSGADIRIIAGYSRVEDIPLDASPATRLDLVFIDLPFQMSEAFRAALNVLRARHGGRIIVFYDEATAVPTEMQEIRHLADAILPKNRIGSDRLVEAINLIRAGLRVLPSDGPTIVQETSATPPPRLTQSAFYVLTARESSVLSQLVQGASNKSIARHLGIAESTVKIHVRNLMTKLGARNRTQAATQAISARHRASDLNQP